MLTSLVDGWPGNRGSERGMHAPTNATRPAGRWVARNARSLLQSLAVLSGESVERQE
jgi:hypothetical protein